MQEKCHICRAVLHRDIATPPVPRQHRAPKLHAQLPLKRVLEEQAEIEQRAYDHAAAKATLRQFASLDPDNAGAGTISIFISRTENVNRRSTRVAKGLGSIVTVTG
jgi:hypothetical protein